MFKSSGYKQVPDPATQPLQPPGTIDSLGQEKGGQAQQGQKGSKPVTSSRGEKEKKDKKKKQQKKPGLVQRAKQVGDDASSLLR